MVSQSHVNAQLDAATKTEQIITEFFAKSLHTILESRALYASSRNSCSSASSSSSVRPRDKWFNLALRECPAALENIDLRRQKNNLESIVIDVILVQRALDRDERVLPKSSSLKERYPLCCKCNADQEELEIEAKSEKIVERWVVQYESRKTTDSNSGNKRSNNSSLHRLYKKLTLLMRSLYTTVRLLPANRIFKELNSSAQVCAFTLAHRVSSVVEPLTQKEEAEMLKFGFTPVDTCTGRLCVAVMYCPSASDVVSSEPSTPLFPQVIPDYVGSPLADPLRRFPSLPGTGFPFPRQYSWNCDHCRAPPPSITYSPPSELDKSMITMQTRPIDEKDDSDFTWPFDLDGDDMADPGSRAEYFDPGRMAEVLEAGGIFPIRKSHDAAVGVLVQMLKNAPPLHQDFSTSDATTTPDSRVSVTTMAANLANQKPKKELSSIQEPNQILEEPRPVSRKSSGVIATRKTASDALEEFHGYKKMKNLLLKQDC